MIEISEQATLRIETEQANAEILYWEERSKIDSAHDISFGRWEESVRRLAAGYLASIYFAHVAELLQSGARPGSIRKAAEELLSTMTSDIVMSDKWPLFPEGGRRRLLITVAKRRLKSGIKQSDAWAQFQRELSRLVDVKGSEIVESSDVLPKAGRHRPGDPPDEEAPNQRSRSSDRPTTNVPRMALNIEGAHRNAIQQPTAEQNQGATNPPLRWSLQKRTKRSVRYKTIDQALEVIAEARPKTHKEVFRTLDERCVALPHAAPFDAAHGWLAGFRKDPPRAHAWLSKTWSRLNLFAFPRGPKK
jgi:hypothetical protein